MTTGPVCFCILHRVDIVRNMYVLHCVSYSTEKHIIIDSTALVDWLMGQGCCKLASNRRSALRWGTLGVNFEISMHELLLLLIYRLVGD